MLQALGASYRPVVGPLVIPTIGERDDGEGGGQEWAQVEKYCGYTRSVSRSMAPHRACSDKLRTAPIVTRGAKTSKRNWNRISDSDQLREYEYWRLINEFEPM